MRRAAPLLALAAVLAPAGTAAATTVDLERLPAAATGARPYPPFIADVDRDGSLDVVTPNFDGDSVTILHGAGDGTLGGREDFPAGPDPVSVSGGWLRYNLLPERVDLVVANYARGYSILDNDGTGALLKRGAANAATVALPLGATDVIAITAVTPIPDIVYSGYDGGEAVAYGSSSFCTLQDPPYTCPGIFTGDLVHLGTGTSLAGALALGYVAGNWEAAITDTQGPDVGVLRASLDQDLLTWVPAGPLLPTPAAPLDVAYGDVDGDGQADIVTADGSANAASLFRRTGPGTFTRTTVAEGCAGASDVELSDLDRDGKLDLVVACPDSGEAQVHLGTGNGLFRAGPVLRGEGGAAFTALGLADLNGDRADDVIAVARESSSVTVFRSRGAATATPARVAFAERDALTVSPAVAVRVRNAASGDIGVASAAITGTGAIHFALVANACTGDGGAPVPIGPADSCTITVAFAPKDVGRLGATLELTLAGGGTLRVPLAGVGVQPGRPRLTKATATAGPKRRGAVVTFMLSRSARVTATLERKAGRRFVKVASVVRRKGFGRATIAVGPKLGVGRYRVRLLAVDGSGRKGSASAAFRIRAR